MPVIGAISQSVYRLSNAKQSFFIAIDGNRVAINHIEAVVQIFTRKDSFQHIVCRKNITGIHYSNPFPRCKLNALVQRIVNTLIPL